MFLQYYVTESTTRNRVNIEINAATKADLDATRNGWQTVWNTDFILDPQKEMWGDRIFEKCGIRRDEGGDGGKTLEIRGKRRLSARDGGANYQQS